MLLESILIEVILLFIFVSLILGFAKNFRIEKKKVLIFILPLLTYAIGFSLRLVGNKEFIDLGFFLTDFSTFFVTILFSLCLYLGQIKYWKVK